MSPIHCLIEQSPGGKLHMLSVVYIAREVFEGGVLLEDKEPISTV
ncbi:unnamed protein product [Staurois parvus]|uniref:FHA domain-containing protein n=1 Tax=Staurois parvus TaxID=386267 RepID=A0ABN9HUS7_9NEOB|nr:unnamed protein product [Staurois parvus]